MKKNIKIAVLSIFSFLSCNSTDEKLTQEAKNSLKPYEKISVEVKDGTAHVMGMFESEAEKSEALAKVKVIDGIKDVMDMAEVSSTELQKSQYETKKKIEDALRNFPSIKIEEIHSEITLTGNVSETQAKKIRDIVNELNVGKVNHNYVVK